MGDRITLDGIECGTESRWIWAAFVYKTTLDAFAAWVSLDTKMTSSKAGMAASGAFAVLGLVTLGYLKRRFHTMPASGPVQTRAS
jgi:hypothetical protein